MVVLELYIEPPDEQTKMASRRKSPPLQPTTTLRPAPLLQQVHAQVTNLYVEEDLEMAARFGDSNSREERSEFNLL